MVPVSRPYFDEKEREYVDDCVKTGWISSAGRYVADFEERFSRFTRSQHAVSASNGTTALHLALLAAGVGPGDEVLVPSFTFVATANAVRHAGGVPILVDVAADTWTLDPDAAERAVTPRTKAIIPVHIYGHPADMDPIVALSRRHGLTVIEDAAEAHGARYKDRPVGSIGDMGVFSFYGNKIVTTGEGGMIVTDNLDFADHMRRLRDHGMTPDRRYWHPEVGYNYRMTNLQAAVGLAQMEKVDFLLRERDTIASAYADGLANCAGVTLPPSAPWAESVCWQFTILLDNNAACSRDELAQFLDESGIETRPTFIPMHEQPIYKSTGDFPVSTALGASGLSLPTWVGLPQASIERIVELISRATGDRNEAHNG